MKPKFWPVNSYNGYSEFWNSFGFCFPLIWRRKQKTLKNGEKNVEKYFF